jgi:ABC-type glycerol-3-phosphate transport system substrate-binding protein
MTRLRWALGLLAAMALVASACTSDSGDGDTQGTGAQGTGGEPVTLEFWAHSGWNADYYNALIDAFEAKYPNIKVNFTPYPEGQYATKVDTAIAAGRPPDLGWIGASLLWVKEGLVLPLDDMVAEQGIDLSSYNPSVVGDPEHVNGEFGCSFQGKLYCLGSYLGSVGVFYNKDMFDAAGIPYPAPWPPMTMEEFVDIGCRLTDKANGVWGVAYGYPPEVLPWEVEFSEDGHTAIVNQPLAVDTYDTMAQGIKDGCAPSLGSMDPWEQGADYFADGQLAMVHTDLEAFRKIEKAGINYGVTGPATPPGVEPFVQTWTDTLGVFAASEHPEEAMLFVAFNTTEGQRIRYEISGDMPLDQAVAEEVNWASGIPGREEALEVVAHARPAVFIPNRWDTVGSLYDAYGFIVGGDLTTQEALDQAEPSLQADLEKAWQVWDQG